MTSFTSANGKLILIAIARSLQRIFAIKSAETRAIS
jgi:hypothetical protein